MCKTSTMLSIWNELYCKLKIPATKKKNAMWSGQWPPKSMMALALNTEVTLGISSLDADTYLNLQGKIFSFLQLQQRWFWSTESTRSTTQYGDVRVTKVLHAYNSFYDCFFCLLKFWFFCLHDNFCQGLQETTWCAATLREYRLSLMLLI